MDRNKGIALGAAGVLGGVAAFLLLRGRAGAEPPPDAELDAGISIRVLDSDGHEVPHNSPVILEPGQYTAEISVTNQSTQAGEPATAVLKTQVEALINGITLIPLTTRSDTFGGNETKAFEASFTVESHTPAASGSIDVKVLDPTDNLLAEASQEIETTGPDLGRPPIDGMGDLDDDGYVTMADKDIWRYFWLREGNYEKGVESLADLTPLSFWEYIRRADMTKEGALASGDERAIELFIEYGTLPEPVYGRRAAINGMGDLNDDGYVDSVDLYLLRSYLRGGSIPIISPLTQGEFQRRADMSGDGQITQADVDAMIAFIEYGEMPIQYGASVNLDVS